MRQISGTTITSYVDNEFGHLMVGGVASVGSGLPTTTLTYGTGARIQDRSASIWYVNRGSVTTPIWEMEPTTVTVAIAAADLIAMYTTPVLLIPAFPGKMIVIDSFEFIITRTSTAFTGGGVVAPQYAATANGAGTLATATVAATVVTGAAGKTYTMRIPVVLSDIASASCEGIGIYLSNQTAVFAAGTGTASVKIIYHLAS